MLGRVPGGPPTTGQRGATVDAVLSAWVAAQQAFEIAARTVDPGLPALVATTVGPQLVSVRSLLASLQAAGDIAEGNVDLGTPAVVSLGSTTAVVDACIHDAEIVVSSATGAPVPGVAGEVAFERLTSTMTWVADGWKLSNEQVEVTTCGA